MKKALCFLLAVILASAITGAVLAEEPAAGIWNLDEMTMNGITLSATELGMSWVFDLRENGMVVMTMDRDGEKNEGSGTWMQAGDILSMTVEGTQLSATIAEGRFSIDQEGMIAVLSRAGAAAEVSGDQGIKTGTSGLGDGIAWGMNRDQVKTVKQAQQNLMRRQHLGEETEGGRPVLYYTFSGIEDNEAEQEAFVFDAETDSLIFTYYRIKKPTMEIYRELKTEYDSKYPIGNEENTGKLNDVLSCIFPEEDLGSIFPVSTVKNSWKAEDGTGTWLVYSESQGLLMVFRASPELTGENT